MLTWLSSLANELKIPMKKKATLKIDNKESTKYHDGEIIQDNQNDLHLLVDNKGAFDIAHSYGPSKRTKHLDVRHHYIQQQINNGVITMTLVPTTEQQADFLTKPVGKKLFKQGLKISVFRYKQYETRIGGRVVLSLQKIVTIRVQLSYKQKTSYFLSVVHSLGHEI